MSALRQTAPHARGADAHRDPLGATIPAVLELDGASLALRWAGREGLRAVLCESRPGAALPDYARRRRIRGLLAARHACQVVLFTDASHSVVVWCWGEGGEQDWERHRERESGWGPAGDGEDWPWPSPPGPARDGEPPDAAVRGPVLSAVVRRLARRRGAVPLHPECEDPRRLLLRRVEAEDERGVREVWRALLDVRVLDPGCGDGRWLRAAAAALEPMYEACLDRMRSAVADARRGGRRRPEWLSDFRATLARSEDCGRWPEPRCYLRQRIAAHNLFGLDADADALARCRARLERFARAGHPAGPGLPLSPLRLLPILPVHPDRARDAPSPMEEWNAARRASALLRRAWLEQRAEKDLVERACMALRRRVEGLAPTPRWAPPLHPCLALHPRGVSGFDLVREHPE